MSERASFWDKKVTYGQVAVFGVTWVVLSTIRDVFGIGPAAVASLIGFIGVTLLTVHDNRASRLRDTQRGEP